MSVLTTILKLHEIAWYIPAVLNIVLIIYFFIVLVNILLWNRKHRVMLSLIEEQLQNAKTENSNLKEENPFDKTFQKAEQLHTSILSLRLLVASRSAK
jgi:hypothetical protein